MDVATHNVQNGKFTVRVISDDQYIGRLIQNGYEWDGWMRIDLPQITTPVKDIIDIGGNIGWNALMFSDYAPVHTFEPWFHPIIRSNIDQNTTQFPITLHPYGLSSENTESDFWLYPHTGDVCNYGGASLHGASDYTKAPSRVQLRRLDDVYSGTPGLIKIDVEGHECEVLKGAEQTIRRHRPFLYVELFDFDRNPATEYIRHLGYTQFVKRPEHNYLCLP